MVIPGLHEFNELAKTDNVVPVYRDLPADLETPISVFLKLRSQGPAFLLESVDHGEQLGRFTFIGTNIRTTIVTKDTKGIVRSEGIQHEFDLSGQDPLNLVKQTMADTHAARTEALPRFFGGAVGYLAYDAVRYFEQIPMPEHDELGLPDASFMIPDTVIAFDHVQRRLKIIILARVDGNPEAAYAMAIQEIDKTIEKLKAAVPNRTAVSSAYEQDQFVPSISKADFEEGVRRAKDYIAAGDAFQIVLSQRFKRQTSAEAFAIYRALRMVNPSPYMFFLDFGEFQLIGSSPESLVKLENGWAETNPIAGTRPRGLNDAEDIALADELIADPKELAEHLMLVDLGRNDIGRVAQPGTVTVPTFKSVEKYSHVMHIVSRVAGQLRPEHDAFSLLRATFPAGTVSGAPKVRAMQIISELEKTRRGPYAGAVGYFGFDGTMDMCIAIRTIVKKGNTVYLQAGAGIVADSDPETEYFETISKAKALETAIPMAEAGGSI